MVAAATDSSYFYEILMALGLQKNHDLTSVLRQSKTTTIEDRPY
jgi:hypothetical protein